MTRAALGLGLALAAACGPKIAPSGVTASDAIIKVSSNVTDAQLYVDGRLIGPLTALRAGIAVEPGPHRFELRHDAYFSSYRELTLTRAQRTQLAMELAPVLP